VGNGSGVSRGDRNRNARLVRLRLLVPAGNAIVGTDLPDAKQMVVVCDHDSKVLARKAFRCRAWDLGAALDWAAGRAAAHGFAGATVACEPTGHRWRVLAQLAAGVGLWLIADPHIGYLLDEPQDGAWRGGRPGARPVALTSAAHASACGSPLACAGRASCDGRERLKRGLRSSK